jgi:hypothetical protein
MRSQATSLSRIHIICVSVVTSFMTMRTNSNGHLKLGGVAMTENNGNEIYRNYAQFNIGYSRSADGHYERERGGISYCCRKMNQALSRGFIRLGPRFGDPQANDTVNIFRAISREGFSIIEPTPIDFCPFCTAKIIVSTAELPGHPVG